MTYAFVQDVPIDATTYDQIVEGLGPVPPRGLIVHLTVERPEGGLRYIDIWEDEESWSEFVDGRLHPVVHALLAEVFGDDLPPEPPRDELAVIHCWSG